MLTVSALYQSETQNRERQPYYRVFVAWTNSSIFIEETRNVAGRINVLREFKDRSNTSSVASFSVTLKNDDRRFSYFNPVSPIAGNITVGKRVAIHAGFQSSESVTIFIGKITRITNNPKRKEVLIVGSDNMEDALNLNVTTDTFENQNVNYILNKFADAAGVPAGKRIFDADGTTISEAWADGNIAVEMAKVVEVAYGKMYYDENENLVYKNKFHEHNDVVTNNPALVVSYDRNLMDMKFDIDDESIINSVEIKTFNRYIGDAEVIWEQVVPTGVLVTDLLRIPATDTKEILVEYDPTNPSTIITPVPNTDYRAVSDIGIPHTNDVTVSFPFGKNTTKSRLLLSNASVVDVYMTKLQVRGQKFFVRPDALQTQHLNSIVNYGERDWTLDNKYVTSDNQAIALATYVLDNYHNPTPNIDDVRVPLVPHIQLSDMVKLNERNSNINSNYFIIRINHDMDNNSAETTLTLKKAPTLPGEYTGANNNIGTGVGSTPTTIFWQLDVNELDLYPIA